MLETIHHEIRFKHVLVISVKFSLCFKVCSKNVWLSYVNNNTVCMWNQAIHRGIPTVLHSITVYINERGRGYPTM